METENLMKERMDQPSENLRQRLKDEPTPTRATTDEDASGKGREEKRKAMAKRGFRSLGVAVSVPLLLTLSNIYFFGSSNNYKMGHRPNWVPPVWALHGACLGSALLMGLCGWIVWAEGGFHKRPSAVKNYLGTIGLALLWDPIVFKLGANWAGLIVAGGICWALFRCYRVFREVNQIAGDMVLPCLAWAGLLAFVNLKFLLS